MLFALVVLALALVVGVLIGGRFDGLAHLPLQYGGLVVLAVLGQLAGTVLGGPFYAVGLAGSAVLVLVFLARNRGVAGTGLVTLGLLGNALVVGLNGAMPVSAHALGRAGLSTQDLLSGADPRHELASASTTLSTMGDVIPVLLPYRPEVVSPGDVLIVAGLAQLVVVAMRRRERGVARL